MVLYEWVLWAHIVSIFGFLAAHGGSSLAVFRIRMTKEPESLRALLGLSRLSVVLSYVFILLVLATGVTLGFLGGFWGRYWIWTAIVVAFIMMGLMYSLGTARFNLLRKAAGLEYYENRKKQQPGQVADASELDRLVTNVRPYEISAVGVVGILVIAWLMVFKPF
ncbi:MAG: hypothetical protein HY296_08190 [Thaumarchaeota archaeon]|nr:hypothetical protein [Nitrososphaerota archaeon]